MKCIEKIYRKEGCARNGHFGVPKSIYRAQKKTMANGLVGGDILTASDIMCKKVKTHTQKLVKNRSICT